VTVLTITIAAVLVAFDFQNLLSWWHGKLVTPGERVSWDFTIVIPLFGHPRYFEGRDAIARYRRNVLVALEVTPPEMQRLQHSWRARAGRSTGSSTPIRTRRT